MNRRVLGCGIAGIIAFVALGVLGLRMAIPDVGCPERLQWSELTYLADGTPAATPSLPEGTPVPIGTTFFGLTTRDVYGPPGSRASASASDRPDVLVLDCGDGSFLAYRRLP